jgi:hypothetical protein
MSFVTLFALAFLIIFTLVATLDGVYLHLFKYKLHTLPECKKEHFLHSLNSLLFPPTVFIFFVVNSAGILLWLGVILTLVTLIIEFLDVYEEKKSRAKMGGLTSFEYAMHFGMSGLRATYTALILCQKPILAWSIFSASLLPNTLLSYPLNIIALCITLLGIPMFILHFYLGRTLEN